MSNTNINELLSLFDDEVPVNDEPSIRDTGQDLKPESFSFNIASSMLESLGVNMYTSIGKSLSEFVANAYDADASTVKIDIPFDDIERERIELRARAKEEVKAKTREPFTVLNEPLPDNVKIVITDNGHGMSPSDIANKLLIVSRNRRKDIYGDKSESGIRSVMGRKGLGKLAGFGTAGQITIKSKREGESFSTSFTMDYDTIKQEGLVNTSLFQASYEDDLPLEDKGTTITLSRLRCDSLKASDKSINDSLGQNFCILGDAFEILLNGKLVEETPSEYEFEYPAEDQRDDEGFATIDVKVDDVVTFPIRYIVKFRARANDPTGQPKTDDKGRILQRGNLLTALRGARIYCNKRLAEGPSLLKLDTGMHNFHSQAYMECIVHADAIDSQEVDHIGTNRADLKGDSEVINALHDVVTEIMRKALYEHSKFRDEEVQKHLEQDEFTKNLLASTHGLSKDVRTSARKLLSTLAASQGVKSDFYKNAAPLLIQSMNAGEVLAELIKIEADPKSINVVAHQLLELARVEVRDVLKLYRGRRNGIEALRKIIQQARDTWKKGKRFENQLHQTLKENPWLIHPDFSRYLTSDRSLGDVAKGLTQFLKIDIHAPDIELDEEGNIKDEDKRPDLVFAMSNSNVPSIVTIVELKTPNYPLRNSHLTQLEGYMLQVENWLKAKFNSPIVVKGILIGDTDANSQVPDVQLLNSKLVKAEGLGVIDIIPLSELLERAKKIHLDAIEALESDETHFDEELKTD